MAKKKSDIDEFSDMFADLKKSTEEVESLLKEGYSQDNKEVVEVKPEVVAKAVTPVKLSTAFGVHKNFETNTWEVAEIHYNPITKECIVHNECALSSHSKAIASARAVEFMARVANNLPLAHARGFKSKT